ncbi:YpoC family protein [Bacillus nitroreducens]
MDNIQEKRISNVIENWDARKDNLTHLFQNREKAEIINLMKDAIDDFYNFLFLMNGKQVPADREKQEFLARLDYKPINLEERLQFVLNKPHQYHSFVQLNVLYLELLKLYAKTKIMKNKK